MKLFILSTSLLSASSFVLQPSIWGKHHDTSLVLRVGKDPNVVTGNDWKPEPGGMQSTVSEGRLVGEGDRKSVV